MPNIGKQYLKPTKPKINGKTSLGRVGREKRDFPYTSPQKKKLYPSTPPKPPYYPLNPPILFFPLFYLISKLLIPLEEIYIIV
jgi:hypothetical protein